MYPSEAYQYLTPEELAISSPEEDNEFEEHIIDSFHDDVIDFNGGWSISIGDSPIKPTPGLKTRLFGKGIGYEVRGIQVEVQVGDTAEATKWETIRYSSPKEHAESHWDWLQAYKAERDEIAKQPIAVDDGKHFYTNEMRQISGFGGGYEITCRRMVLSGIRWIEEHPEADPQFHGYENIYGIINEDNDDAKELSKAVELGSIDPDDPNGEPDCTGAMHQAAISHVLWIKKNGWDKYVETMSKPEETEVEEVEVEETEVEEVEVEETEVEPYFEHLKGIEEI